MIPSIHVEDIYDAAIDDRLFDALPALLANGIGARSGVLHWHATTTPDLGELRHSHYFTEAHLAMIEPDMDIWSEASRGACDRAIRCDDIVSADAFAASRIYNEWVVDIGDDSFFATGATITLPGIEAEFGFHRARGHGRFDDDAVEALQRQLGPLRRLIGFRARIATAETRATTMQAALDVGGDAVLILDAQHRLLHANRAGEALLARGDMLTMRGGVVHGRKAVDDRDLQVGLRAATARDGPRGSSLMLGDMDGSGRHAASLLPTMIDGRRRIVAILSEPDHDAGRAERFATLHGLTAAEAEIAVMLADAHAPADIAKRRGTSIMTVRSQIKTILAKTGSARQADIVAAVHALPRIAAPRR